MLTLKPESNIGKVYTMGELALPLAGWIVCFAEPSQISAAIRAKRDLGCD